MAVPGIIAVISEKGGGGKSTTAVHLARWLDQQGRRVLVVDADPTQAAATRWLREAAPGVRVAPAATPDELLEVDIGEADHVVIDGPAGLAERELWRGHTKKDGTPFVSFYDAATTPIPYGLGLDCPGDHLSYREAIRYCEVMPANKRVAELLRSEEAKGNPLGKQGGTGANQHTKEEESKGSDRTSARKRGENAAYLTARIERDAPEIAERLAQGQFRSVRQAAIEAGIIKVPTDRVGCTRGGGQCRLSTLRVPGAAGRRSAEMVDFHRDHRPSGHAGSKPVTATEPESPEPHEPGRGSPDARGSKPPIPMRSDLLVWSRTGEDPAQSLLFSAIRAFEQVEKDRRRSNKALAEFLGMSRNHIGRHLAALVSHGDIRKGRKGWEAVAMHRGDRRVVGWAPLWLFRTPLEAGAQVVASIIHKLDQKNADRGCDAGADYIGRELGRKRSWVDAQLAKIRARGVLGQGPALSSKSARRRWLKRPAEAQNCTNQWDVFNTPEGVQNCTNHGDGNCTNREREGAETAPITGTTGDVPEVDRSSAPAAQALPALPRENSLPESASADSKWMATTGSDVRTQSNPPTHQPEESSPPTTTDSEWSAATGNAALTPPKVNPTESDPTTTTDSKWMATRRPKPTRTPYTAAPMHREGFARMGTGSGEPMSIGEAMQLQRRREDLQGLPPPVKAVADALAQGGVCFFVAIAKRIVAAGGGVEDVALLFRLAKQRDTQGTPAAWLAANTKHPGEAIAFLEGEVVRMRAELEDEKRTRTETARMLRMVAIYDVEEDIRRLRSVA
eukprot:g15760.t1